MITFSEAELRVKIIKAMAHPVRLMVIELLLGGERSFTEIFRLFHLDKSTISKHLLVLKESGVISSRKTGREMIYKLEVPCVADFFTCATVVIKNKMQKQLYCLGR
ncbi:MAG: transcriptional regulator [Syntrophus sp. RIFOXYC2_FULL_54_9]|nr:MAG: transcriptional regulator [Syntrophus sp. GWC2_56_31]OHE32037.1 MAG: transcriptional regulator [Syntrophus sp. RIFOXYC2_FULL_54_9]HBB16796.1 transcriptional regulator [Syntrophus sp. (in: bacteria)]